MFMSCVLFSYIIVCNIFFDYQYIGLRKKRSPNF
jgi:hypothetical protein